VAGARSVASVPDIHDRAAALAAPARSAPSRSPAAPAEGKDAPSSSAPWRPVVPAEGDPDSAPDSDVEAVASRLRQGALGAVSAAYASEHGHPLGIHPDDADAPAPARRWAVAARTAVLALVALATLAAAVVTVAVSHGAGQPTTLPTAASAAMPTPVGTRGALGAPDDGDDAGSASAPVEAAAPSAAPSAGPAGASAVVIVDVVGAVRHPGVVRLTSGARLSDAIEAAGGATSKADLEQVNLAATAVDGQQVRVPQHGEAVAPPTQAAADGAAATAGSAADPAGATAPVDLNTAGATELDALPGIGPVLAQRIVDWRTQHGRFTTVDELEEVPGIGPSLLAKVRDQARV
jgi:competence protein ComEA